MTHLADSGEPRGVSSVYVLFTYMYLSIMYCTCNAWVDKKNKRFTLLDVKI